MRQEGDLDLSPTLIAALSTVERFGPLGPSELARIEGVRRPTATRVIARLRQAGLVTRLPDARDRRAALLEVTPAGREALRTLRRRKAAYLARRLEGLTDDERATLARASDILERLLCEEGDFA